MPIVLYLGRHGETKLNSEDKLRGWMDVPLNPAGIKEAHKMADLMKQFSIDRIYCSDLDRADHTATIVGNEHELKPIPRMWFRPLNYGDMNGKSLKDIQPKLDELNQIWKTNPDHEAPGGESFREFQDRNLGGLHAIMSAAKDDEQIMIVAHLRNCLLFWGVAQMGEPLSGDAIEIMAGKIFHQESGAVSKYEYDDGKLKYIGLVTAKEKVSA
jgi:alpha-ribazole phosphatase